MTSYTRPCHALNFLSLHPPPTHFANFKTGSIVTGTKADQPPRGLRSAPAGGSPMFYEIGTYMLPTGAVLRVLLRNCDLGVT